MIFYTDILTKNNFNTLYYFDIKILNIYYNDPRYQISNLNDRVNISIKTENANDVSIDSRERIVLDNIGLGFNKSGQRVIGIFLKDLARLDKCIQLRFKSFEENDVCLMSPYFIKNMYKGEWIDGWPIFDAILSELKILNDMCRKTGNENLFLKEFNDNKPEKFRIILFSTRDEYYTFINIFDKILSENLNKKFFKGKVEEKEKGTLKLLEGFLKLIKSNEEDIDLIISSLKMVRKERNRFGHKIENNSFNIKYYEKQTDILMQVYCGLKKMIIIFKSYFKLNGYEFEEWFKNNQIITYSIEEFIKVYQKEFEV